MKRLFWLFVLLLVVAGRATAHDPSATPIAWNREISRIIYERCASCHRIGGSAFSLMSYQDAQHAGAAIKDSVLARRMPPWGAVEGFGYFRNDEGLTQQQIDLIASWVEEGMTKGNNPNALPPIPRFDKLSRYKTPKNAIAVSGALTLKKPMMIDGLYPEHVSQGASMQIVAALPDGDVKPLLWLYEYSDAYRHPFLLRTPFEIPAGTVIRGVRPDAKILLLPVAAIAK